MRFPKELNFKYKKTSEWLSKNLIYILIPVVIFCGYDLLYSPSTESALNFRSIQDQSNQELPIEIQSFAANAQVSLADIINARKTFFEKYSFVESAKYSPKKEIFEKAGDDLPWFSKKDLLLPLESGKLWQSEPLDSVGLLNPALLIYPHFNSLPSKLKKEISDQLSEDQLLKLPIFPEISGFKYNSSTNTFSVNYNLTEFKQIMDANLDRPISLNNIMISLRRFNAVDLGFDWFALSAESSVNIKRNGLQDLTHQRLYADSFIKIDAALSNGAESPGNVRMPFDDSDYAFVVTELPAIMSIYLWDNEPDKNLSSPDVTFRIMLD